ncbi:MlaD family protein [Candidatus Hydrogenedentota bacterium]
MSYETRVGLFFIVGMAILGFLTLYINEPISLEDYYVLRTHFDNVNGLVKGDNVTLGGVKVGEVDSVAIVNGTVSVALKIRQGAVVRADSVATVKTVSMVGGHFVDVTHGSADAPPVQDGGTIEGKGSADFGQVMAKVDELAGDLGGLIKSFDENQGKTFGKLNEILETNEEKISATFDNLSEAGEKMSLTFDSLYNISSKVERGEGLLGKLVADDEFSAKAEGVVDRIDGASLKMDEAFGGISRITAQIESGEGTFARLLADDTLLVSAESAFDRIGEAADDVSLFVKKLNTGEGSAAKLINDPGLYDEAKKALSEVSRAAESFRESSTTGTFTSVLFGAAF